MTSLNVNPEMSLEEGQNLYQTAIRSAGANLAALGVQSPFPPNTSGPGGATVPYRGELPPNLTDLTDNELGTYLGLLTEWGNYVGYQLAAADASLTAAKADLHLVEAKLRIVYQKDPESKKKRSSAERDDYVGADRRYIEANSQVLYWETMYIYLKAITNAAVDSFAAVSRRVTQRGQEVDRMTRTGNTTGPGNISVPLFGHHRR